MTDEALVAFLAWAVPRLGLRLRGVGHFRGTVKKRLARRLAELRIGDLDAYRTRLEQDPAEWDALDAMCRIPISRLYRDAEIWARLGADILPERARIARDEGRSAVRVWSAGCASGEEPYTVAMVWHVDVAPSHPDVELEVIATDADEDILVRARRGEYGRGSLRELPPRMLERCLHPIGALFRVDDACRAAVTFRCEDLRRAQPEGVFDVILCRNTLLTYIEEPAHLPLLGRLVSKLRPEGALIVGARESMPAEVDGIEPWNAIAGVYRRLPTLR